VSEKKKCTRAGDEGDMLQNVALLKLMCGWVQRYSTVRKDLCLKGQ